MKMVADSDFQELSDELGRWDYRRRQTEALLWLPRGLLAGLLAAAIVAVITRLLPTLTNRELFYVIAGLALSGLFLSFLLILSRRRSPVELAQFVDREFELFERASAAVEIHEGRLETTPELADKQLEDTIQTLAAMDTKTALPLRPNWLDLIWILLTLALLAVSELLFCAQYWGQPPRLCCLKTTSRFSACRF